MKRLITNSNSKQESVPLQIQDMKDFENDLRTFNLELYLTNF